MGEAKISLKLDIREALESLDKLKREARNITGRGGGHGIAGQNQADILSFKSRLKQEDMLYAHKLRLEQNLQRQKLWFEKKRHLDEQRDVRITEREKIRSIERVARAEQQAIRKNQAEFRRLAQAGSGGLFNSTFQAGLTRLGGMGGGGIGSSVTRNMITGGFLGQGTGSLVGGPVRGAFGAVANQFAAYGPWGRAFGSAISRTGGILGSAMPVIGALKGAQIGATMSIAGAGFSAAVNVFSSAARTLAGAVSSLVGRGIGMARNVAMAGVAGGIATTTAGVAALSSRVKAETALGVVGGRNAADLGSYGNMMARQPGNMFSRTGILEALTRSSAFGMSPGLVKSFMPKMMNASAIFGEDVSEGMRALARAAFQSEPEAAEKFGLNLYEKNLKAQFGNRYDLNNPQQKAQAVFEAASQQLEKFRGGMGAIRNTPGGAFTYVKNKTTDLLENVGGGFSSGFNLVPRLNKMGAAIGSSGTKGAAYNIAEGVGRLAGRGADFLTSTFSGANISSFLSSRNEGNTASAVGDTAKQMIASIMGGAQTILNMANQLWDKLVGPDGLFNKMKSQWNDFSSDWEKGVRSKIIPAIGQAFDYIHKEIGAIGEELGAAFLSGATGGLFGKSKEMAASREGIAGGAGMIAGGIQGFVQTPGPLPAKLLGAGVGAIRTGFAAGAMANFTRYLPSFAEGGTVPGPTGAPVLAKVHGGEQILNKKQQRSFMSRMYTGITGNPVPQIPDLFRRASAMRGSAYQSINKEEGPTSSGVIVTTVLNSLTDQAVKMINKHQGKIDSFFKEVEKAKESFKKSTVNARPTVDNAFDAIASMLGAGGGMGPGGGSGLSLPMGSAPIGFNGAKGRNGRNIARGTVLSRVPQGTPVPIPFVSQEGKSLDDLAYDALRPGPGRGFRFRPWHGGDYGPRQIVSNHYGNAYYRGDSNSLMRQAEGVW